MSLLHTLSPRPTAQPLPNFPEKYWLSPEFEELSSWLIKGLRGFWGEHQKHNKCWPATFPLSLFISHPPFKATARSPQELTHGSSPQAKALIISVFAPSKLVQWCSQQRKLFLKEKLPDDPKREWFLLSQWHLIHLCHEPRIQIFVDILKSTFVDSYSLH